MKALCLACGGDLGGEVFSTPDLPLVDSFELTPEKASRVPSYPVSIAQCATCFTLQIVSPPDTSEIYRNYIYESSSSPDLDAHFKEYAQFIHRLSIPQNAKILEIGANDGLLLKHLRALGYLDLTAVDPSPQTAQLPSTIPNVRVINNFFSRNAMSGEPRGEYSIIIANNCFSHIPSLAEVLQLCATLLSRKGILIVEVQSTLDRLQSLIFDYIYHEHYFYHSVTSFRRLTRMIGLEVLDVSHVPTKGGSYRLIVGRPDEHATRESVRYWEYRERISNVHARDSWQAMRDHLRQVRSALHSVLSDFPGEISAYGASATGTVLMRYMGIESHIKFIVDDNEKRQGRFSPGAALPVVSSKELTRSNLCVILAWRHRQKIVATLQKAGVPFICPLPILEINGR